MRLSVEAAAKRAEVIDALRAAQNFIRLAEASFSAGNHPRFPISDLADAETHIGRARSLLK